MKWSIWRPSKKFPEAPAPKVVEGYETIRRYGCFGCHEINGFAGPQQRIGPDMRLEPNYFAAAAQLEVDPGLAKLAPDAVSLAKEVARIPITKQPAAGCTSSWPLTRPPSIRRSTPLRASSKACSATRHPRHDPQGRPEPAAREEQAGLRFSDKLDREPDAIPPRHADAAVLRRVGSSENPAAAGMEESQRIGAGRDPGHRGISVEIERQPFDYESPPEGVAAADGGDHAAAIARGKKVFEVRGCLACHKHADFPGRWRCKAPICRGSAPSWRPIPTGESGSTVGSATPAVTIRAATCRTCFSNRRTTPKAEDRSCRGCGRIPDRRRSRIGKPTNALKRDLTKEDEEAIEDLAVQYLSEKFPRDRALRYVTDGIPKGQAESVQGDEAVLVNLKPTGLAVKEPAGQGETAEHHQQRITRKLDYVGRRSIGKYGCFGCHDIPGYRRRQADRHRAERLGPQGSRPVGIRARRRISQSASQRFPARRKGFGPGLASHRTVRQPAIRQPQAARSQNFGRGERDEC